jgi:hypothetical protein
VRRFLYIITLLIFPFLSNAQDYHPLCYRDSLEYGSNITRTLSLLGSSVSSRQNQVNIIVYGQSVSKQEWWLFLKEKLENAFPWAKINMINKSVGGFSSQKLPLTIYFPFILTWLYSMFTALIMTTRRYYK